MKVRSAAAEAAEDDAYFAAADLEVEAGRLFSDAQLAWDARDRKRLAELVGDDLLIEWLRRLDDFDKKGWHNRVEVLERAADPATSGITNREDDDEDRAVVRIKAQLQGLRRRTRTATGSCARARPTRRSRSPSTGRSPAATAAGSWRASSSRPRATTTSTRRSWPRPGRTSAWPTRRSPSWPSEDKLPEGFTTADLAELDFAADARAHALDLSLADAPLRARRARGGGAPRGRRLGRGRGRRGRAARAGGERGAP